MDYDKIKEVFTDEAFVKELFSLEEPEDVQAALEEKGIVLTLDEVKSLGQLLYKASTGEISQEQMEKMANGELSEEELEEVAGGFGTLAFIGVCIFAIAVGGGGAYGAYVAATSDSVSNFFKNTVPDFFSRW